MQRVSSYLKMRVLGAIESAPGESIVARIRHISDQVFVDEDGQRFRFTWRTIQTWYSRYKKDGTTTVLPKPRSDKGKTRKMTPEEVLDAVDLLELDGFGAIPHGLEHGAHTEISRLAQTAFGRAHDEAERVVGEGAVSERGLVEL